MSYFKYIIIQYAQHYMIENKINRVYYSSILSQLDDLGETTLNIISDSVSNYTKDIDIYSLDNEMDDFNEKKFAELVNKHFRPKFDTITIYIPNDKEPTGFKIVKL